MTACEKETEYNEAMAEKFQKKVDEKLPSMEIGYLKNRIALMEKDNLNIKSLLKVAVALLDD